MVEGHAQGKALGRMAAGVHVLPLRVYWEDTDALGMVYYANYLKFIERARSDLLALAGIDQAALWHELGIAFPVHSCTMEYRRPARFADDLEVHTRLSEVRAASLVAEQALYHRPVPLKAGKPPSAAKAGALFQARLRLACIDAKGRPCRMPAVVVKALATLSPSLS
jgi:acyl-CoA thioester hydrolase